MNEAEVTFLNKDGFCSAPFLWLVHVFLSVFTVFAACKCSGPGLASAQGDDVIGEEDEDIEVEDDDEETVSVPEPEGGTLEPDEGEVRGRELM